MTRISGPGLETNEDGVPYVYERALEIYDYMMDNLSNSLYDNKYKMYKGKITAHLQQDLGITPSQYSRSIELLKSIDAVEQIGRSNDGSSWVLYYRPTVEQFEQSRQEQFKNRRRATKDQITEQRMHDLTLLVSDLQSRVTHLERMADG